MKKNNKLWFTLVELLVVITILAIISVVAYQNFGWAVDKAVSGRKISDVSTIETALQQYKSDKNYYPATSQSWSNNLWWYDSTKIAKPSNFIEIEYDWDSLSWITDSNWWWIVYWTWAFSSIQIWAKGTISQEILGKKYLSKDLYDPELWDLSLKWPKMIEYWIGRYIYATFKKNSWIWPWASNFNWNAYNIAYTIKKDWSDTYMTKIVWDYDSDSCYTENVNCPETLIWSWTEVLLNNETLSGSLSNSNFHIPYPVTDFKAQ
jgi:prepilin-type N-terminal cleavage/methylation domain-containing protein